MPVAAAYELTGSAFGSGVDFGKRVGPDRAELEASAAVVQLVIEVEQVGTELAGRTRSAVVLRGLGLVRGTGNLWGVAYDAAAANSLFVGP